MNDLLIIIVSCIKIFNKGEVVKSLILFAIFLFFVGCGKEITQPVQIIQAQKKVMIYVDTVRYVSNVQVYREYILIGQAPCSLLVEKGDTLKAQFSVTVSNYAINAPTCNCVADGSGLQWHIKCTQLFVAEVDTFWKVGKL